MDNSIILLLSSGLAGLLVGIGACVVMSRAGLNKNQQKAALVVKEAQAKADNLVKQAVLDGRTQAHEIKIQAEKEVKDRKAEVAEMENKLLRREDNLNFRDETLTSKEKQLEAFQKARDKALEILGDTTVKALGEIYGDFDAWLDTKIEQV